jgi:hypothetical protein
VIDVDALWKVLLAGLVGGAGLVALYALGLVGMAAFTAGDRVFRGRSLAGLALAVTCFAVVLAGVALALYVLLAA